MAIAVQTEYSRDILKIRGCYQRTQICCCPSPIIMKKSYLLQINHHALGSNSQ